MQRYLFADINPLMRPIKKFDRLSSARTAKPASADNPFSAMEKDFAALTENMLNMYRDYRDFWPGTIVSDRLTATIGCSFSFRHLKQNRS